MDPTPTDQQTLDQIVDITSVSAKHWQPFEVTSPGGIPFAGFLSRHESERYGMLALTQVDGVEWLDFVPSMPKLHYPYLKEHDGRRVVISVPQNVVDARFNVKLDGTAIIFYGLPDKEGNVLEVIPRTRLQPILTPSRWGDWNALLADALPDRSTVENAVRTQRVVLVFELWGHRNPHLVTYETPLALTLHTAIRHRKPLSHRLLADLAARYGLDLVESIAVETPDAEGLARAYRRLQVEMETRNEAANRAAMQVNDYGVEHERVFAEEGAILMLSTQETATYYKCKPPSIEEIHWQPDQAISRAHVEQAIYKLLENGYDFVGGRPEDVHPLLEEDFDREEVLDDADLISRIYTEFSVEQQRRLWLRQQVEHSGLDPRDLPNLMRYLSQHYPKNQMSWVYNTAKSMYGEG